MKALELYGLEVVTTAESARMWFESTFSRLSPATLEVAQQLELSWILDIPAGIAMKVLEERSLLERSRSVVISANLSPEYLEHLWSLSPRALIGEPFGLEDLSRALEELSSGKRVRYTYTLDLRVQGALFEVLVAAARFEGNRGIAVKLGKAEQTIKNEMGQLVDALGLSGREQLHSYFFGDWMYLPAPYREIHERITRGEGRKYVVAEHRALEPAMQLAPKRKRR